MAVQSGVLFFDSRPTDDECGLLAAGLEPLALDGVSTVARAGIAMAFGACHVWTGEKGCTQPLQTSAGSILTWDGRLDNRDDLLLQVRGRIEPGATDAALAMAVFEQWGVEGFRSLIGDWSLALWDSRVHRLHLARDYMGVRPLYYCADERSVMWSTSLGELAVRSGRVDDLNEAFVARFMTLQFSPEVTPYNGIHAVPTATTVTFSDDRVETRRRFWSLEPGDVRYRDSRQYEEHLRALWVDAVGSRLRTSGAVWAELSGGLDSSSLVCMADALIRGGRVPAAELRSVSHVTLESPEGDERRFVAVIDERTGRQTDVLGVELHEEESDPDWDWITPLAPRGVKARSIRHVREAAGRLVLTGRVGDCVMGGIPDNSIAVFDDLRALCVPSALSNMRQWSRACRKPFLEIAWTLACEAVGIRPPTDPVRASVLAPHLTSHLIDHTPLQGDACSFRLAQRRQARMILFYMRQARLETWVGRDHVTETHPFAHRPLVEYMLAIPGRELSTPGTTRSLMRRAFTGLVPDRNLRRESKGHYAPVGLRTARNRLHTLPPVEQLECVARGWIDPMRLGQAISTLRRSGDDIGSNVRRALRLERWLASRHRRGPAVIPTRKEVRTNDVRIA